MNTFNKNARIAGALYLFYIVVHIFSDVIGRTNLIVIGNSAETAQNILAFEWQFRLGVVGNIIAALLFLITAWALYVVFQTVNKNLALLFLLLNLGGVGIQCLSDLFLLGGQLILTSPDLAHVFQVNQLQAMAMFFFTLRDTCFMICQAFFAAWLFPLGYLVYKSGSLPKIFGILLMIHFFTWMSTFIQHFLFPGFDTIIYLSYPLGFFAEFGLGLWLLIRGAKEQTHA